MYLQDRIEELQSGILEIDGNKVNMTGYYSKDRLLDYLDKGLDAYFSKGVYDYEKLDFGKVKNNTLFIIYKDGKEIARYEFQGIKKGTFDYDEKNNVNGKGTKTYLIRYCKWSKMYNYIDNETNITFSNKIDLVNFLLEKYHINLDF